MLFVDLPDWAKRTIQNENSEKVVTKLYLLFNHQGKWPGDLSKKMARKAVKSVFSFLHLSVSDKLFDHLWKDTIGDKDEKITEQEDLENVIKKLIEEIKEHGRDMATV